MTFPVTVTFDGIEPSDPLRAHVIERAQRLERFAPDILACHVVVAAASHRQHQGNVYSAHVRLTMPHREIEAGGHDAPGGRHEDPYVAVGDAFDALRRRIEDRVRVRRGDVKTHTNR